MEQRSPMEKLYFAYDALNGLLDFAQEQKKSTQDLIKQTSDSVSELNKVAKRLSESAGAVVNSADTRIITGLNTALQIHSAQFIGAFEKAAEAAVDAESAYRDAARWAIWRTLAVAVCVSGCSFIASYYAIKLSIPSIAEVRTLRQTQLELNAQIVELTSLVRSQGQSGVKVQKGRGR